MSFTIKVKEEIIAASSKDIAELSALIKMSGSVGLTNQGLTLSISTENAKNCSSYLPVDRKSLPLQS